ncbi:hypothetical protein ES705_21391 [subsurface metagenome]
MKIFISGTAWIGIIKEDIAEGFKENGIEPIILNYTDVKTSYESYYKTLKLHQINYFNKKHFDNKIVKYNNEVIEKSRKLRPDLFLTFSGGFLLPSTVDFLRNNLKVKTISIVADNPFDSSREKYFPMALPYYDHIFVCDSIWIENISKVVGKDVKIHKYTLGYSPKYFYPISQNEISPLDIENFSCDMSFTGSNYSNKAEGAYRSGIINQLDSFNVKLWGDETWKERFIYHKNLQKFYQGIRLSWSDLRKLYTLSTINLNLPSPQAFTTFQPRTFNVAAVKGFQIIDKRPDLYNYFKEDELVTFETIPELIEKAKYFINNPGDRKSNVENLYNKIVNRFTWQNQVKLLLDIIK